MRNQHSIKTVFLGESGIGKTCITYRMIKDIFSENMDSTVGASFLILTYDDIKYEIWDTAGQERYLSLVPMYYRNSDLIILVFDMSRPRTMDIFKFYLDKITHNLTTEYRIIVVGNKCDLIQETDIIKIDKDVRLILKSYDLELYTDFIYISAKTGINFSEYVNKVKILGSEMASIKYPQYFEYGNIINFSENKFNQIINNDVKYCNC